MNVCPICSKVYNEPPALSRADNKTPVCPDCGLCEALSAAGMSGKEQTQVLKTVHAYSC